MPHFHIFHAAWRCQNGSMTTADIASRGQQRLGISQQRGTGIWRMAFITRRDGKVLELTKRSEARAITIQQRELVQPSRNYHHISRIARDAIQAPRDGATGKHGASAKASRIIQPGRRPSTRGSPAPESCASRSCFLRCGFIITKGPTASAELLSATRLHRS